MTTHRLGIVSRREALTVLAAGSGGLFCSALASSGNHAEAETAVLAATQQGALKVIGVLGGIGPQATMDFEMRVHRAAQRVLPQRANGGYPPMVVYYHRHPPIRLNDDLSPRIPIEADPRLLDAARRLGGWADFLVITSNGAHMIQPQVEHASGRDVLSMIDVTLAEVQRRGWQQVGVLAFGDPMIYTGPLRARKVACETIGGTLQRSIDDAVMKVMEGRDGATERMAAESAVETLRERKIDGVILGCTEIPLLLGSGANSADLINPADLLAEAAVRRAM